MTLCRKIMHQVIHLSVKCVRMDPTILETPIYETQYHPMPKTLKFIIPHKLPFGRNILLTHYAAGDIPILHLIASPRVILILPPLLQLSHRGLPIELPLRVTYYVITAPKIPFQYETLRQRVKVNIFQPFIHA